MMGSRHHHHHHPHGPMNHLLAMTSVTTILLAAPDAMAQIARLAPQVAALRKRYASVVDKSALDPLLERAGCLRWLT